MSQSFTLVFNSKYYILPFKFKMLEQISTNIIQALTSNNFKYQIQSNISEEVFQQFYQYLIDGTEPDINSDTIYELEQISQEFQIKELQVKIDEEKKLIKSFINKHCELYCSYGEIPSNSKNFIEVISDLNHFFYVRKRIEYKSQQREDFTREVMFLIKVKNSYPFVSLVEFEYPNMENEGYIITKYMEGGSVMKQIEIKNNNNNNNDDDSFSSNNLPHSAFSDNFVPFKEIKLDNTRKMIIIYGVAKAISFLHHQSPPILHCNICPENILLDSEGDPYLSGFSLARKISQKGQIIGNINGNISYVAPEIIKNENADISADIYSFGVTMIMVFTEKLTITDNDRKLDFNTISEKKKIALKQNRIEFDIPKDISIQIRELIHKCCDDDKSLRPTIDEILNILESEQIISMFENQ